MTFPDGELLSIDFECDVFNFDAGNILDVSASELKELFDILGMLDGDREAEHDETSQAYPNEMYV
ncbi:MAG: hypothetical protein ABEJ99_06060 [Candidatus Nanohaloarchaea archaeon]